MNLLLHHVRKDLLHSRWLISITWLAAASVLWLTTMPLERRVEGFEWLPFIRYGSWILLFLTIGRIVQLDAPLRDTAFHRSRPVSPGEWLASKLATSVIVLLPMALLQVVMILLLGMRPELVDLLLILVEEILVLGVVLAIAMAIATRSKTYANFIAAAMGCVFAVFIVIAVYVNAADLIARETKPAWSHDTTYLKLSRILITQIIATFGLLGGLFICIRTRRVESLTTALAGTTLAAAFAWFFWPVNIVKTFARPEAAAPRSEWPDQSTIDFAFEERLTGPNTKSKFGWGFGGYSSGYYQHVKAYCRMEELDQSWFAYPNGHRSSLRSPAGITASSLQDHTGGIATEVILPALGLQSPWERVNGATEVQVGEFPVPAVEAAGANATLEGVVHIPLKRPVVLARIPLRAGATVRIGNRRLTITSVEIAKPELIDYQVIEERAINQFRGGRHGEPHRDVRMIAIHQGRGEFLQMHSRGSSGHAIGCYSLTRLDHKETIWRDPIQQVQDRTIPPDWLDGAELIITGDEYGGTFTHEFRFENVNLIDKSWRP